MFDKPGVFYSKDPTTIFADEWLLDHFKIEGLKSYNLAVLDFSSEHYGADGLDYVYQALASANVNFLLLTHNPHEHQKFDRMLFYPHWYHWSRKNFILTNNDSNDRTYAWSCLNGNPRAHRIYNYFYSQQQSYFESACFTIYNNDVYRHDDVMLSADAAEFWANTKDKLSRRDSVFTPGGLVGARCNIPSLIDSYIHLVTETTVIPNIFVSEKSWKPIATGQLFLVFGNPGTVSYLRNQGVDVFDDIIDHSYDSNLDWQSRLHQIHQQLQQLILQDLKSLYINTQQRRRANSEKFLSGAFDQTYQKTIEQCINTLN